MIEDWLDKNGRALGLGWLGSLAGGIFIYGGLTSGWGRAISVAATMIALMIGIIGTLVALILVAGDE